jgi:hypothetical protein
VYGFALGERKSVHERIENTLLPQAKGYLEALTT